jgi:hypothetical protein
MNHTRLQTMETEVSVERKKFPDISRQRRKEREADFMSQIEEQLKWHTYMLNRMSQQGTTASQS